MKQLVIIGIALAFATTTAAAQQNEVVRVYVRATTGSTAALISSSAPYTEGGPVAKVYLPSGTDARTRDGGLIVGFDFTAWTAGDETRGQVFALVSSSSAAPDVDLRYRSELLQRREFASYRLRLGESVSITEMRSVGLEPMIVEAQTLRDLFAQLERLRDRLEKH